jgi:hypothetical protein
MVSPPAAKSRRQATTNGDDGSPTSATEKKKSEWLLPDDVCPKLWFVAPAGVIPPTGKALSL